MIKFRAWYKKNTLPMLSVSLISFDQKFIDAYIDKEFQSETEMSFDFDDVILMQSTGLFDRDGQEIFEGDLLDTSDPTGNIISSGNPVIEVRFNGLEFTVKGDIENDEMSLREFKEICECAGIPLKVIGSIQETPDLVEVSL